MEVLLRENTVLPPAPVDFEAKFVSDEADMSLPQAEKDIIEIRETLRWHSKIGWGAIALYASIAVGFTTWYLPKELSTQKTDIIQEIARNSVES